MAHKLLFINGQWGADSTCRKIGPGPVAERVLRPRARRSLTIGFHFYLMLSLVFQSQFDCPLKLMFPVEAQSQFDLAWCERRASRSARHECQYSSVDLLSPRPIPRPFHGQTVRGLRSPATLETFPTPLQILSSRPQPGAPGREPYAWGSVFMNRR